MTLKAFVVEELDVPRESGEDRGVYWRTLTSADRTPTTEITCGVCEIEPGCELPLHRHPPLEIYYIMEGSGIVTLGSERRAVRPGTTISIPGNSPHGIRNDGQTTLRLFYAFPAASYSDIEYTMLEGPSA